MRRCVRLGLGLAAVLVLLASLSAHAQSTTPGGAPSEDTARPTQFSVAIPSGYLPIAGINLNGEPAGLLPDIWRLWSEKTGVPVRFEVASFSDTISMLRHGKVDVHAALFRNEVRESWLDFTRPFHESTSGFYILRSRNDISSADALGGKAIGVVRQTHQEGFLKYGGHGYRPKTYDGSQALLRGLYAGEVDAILHEDEAMSTLLYSAGVKGDVLRLQGDVLRNAIFSAFRQNRPGLRNLIDWGFTMISRDEYAEIESRWVEDPKDRLYRPQGTSVDLNEVERAFLQEHKNVRVGMMNNWPPMNSVDETGKLTGMSAAIGRLVNERLGGIMTFVPGSWTDLLEDVKEKRLDAVFDISPTEARIPHYKFTFPYLEIHHGIVTHEKNADRKVMGEPGVRVALERGYASVAYINTNYPQAKIQEYASTEDALAAVAADEADAYIGNIAAVRYRISENRDKLAVLRIAEELPNRKSVLAIGTRHDWPILRGIFNKALIGITPAQLRKITDPWLKGSVGGNINVNADEQRWLTDHAGTTLRASIEPWPPVLFMKDGQPSGIAVNYLRYIMNALDLDLKFVEMPWKDTLPAIGKFEKIDIVSSAANTPERREIVNFTEPFISLPQVIFMRDDAPLISGLSDLNGHTVAVEAGFITASLLRKDYPNIKLLEVNNTHDAMQAVSFSRADAYFGNLVAGSYHIEQHGFTNLKVAAPSGYDNNVQSFGVRRDWPELASLMNKVLASMNEEEHARIRGEAMALKFEAGIDFKQILQYAIPAGVVILIIFGVFVYANHKLAGEVAERKKAEESLTEKDMQLTNALENMSGGMFMVDRHMHMRVFNQKFRALYQLPDIVPGTSLKDVLMIRAARGEYGPGDPDDLVGERLAGYLTREAVRTEDIVPDGRIIEGFRQPTDDGGMVCVFNDITERKRAEKALAEQTTKLQDLSEKLSRYLSPQIYEAIFSGVSDANVQTERKKLTVFFSDIKNFTATTEEMEPEDMTFLLNDYLTKMTEIALEHGGTIDKYIGDAIMVFFGDPVSRGVKEDAKAAVKMAIAMQRRMVDLRAKWADMGFRYPFHIRCGVNTGYCNVGNFGSEQRIDYTIIGGQVNLAARLEGICEPDGVTLSYETYSLVRDEVDAIELEPIHVKGIKEPVKPYALQGFLEDWDETERYIRRDDVSGLRLWVDLMRITEEHRLASIRELEEAVEILRLKKADNAAE